MNKVKMTVGELRHTIAKVYLKKQDKKVIIVSWDDGETFELDSMEDALKFKLNDGCSVEVVMSQHWEERVEDDSCFVIVIQKEKELQFVDFFK